ncbi:unnamed protein product [Cuscuta epithymum]|uniref:Uncharacterized protein n=1 Tax=Cuscuta epithymum TaxID=186058 RepID=A0AAV0G1K3_9ASTE|nr:unnamed protein product [Cuscuta epithymum]
MENITPLKSSPKYLSKSDDNLLWLFLKVEKINDANEWKVDSGLPNTFVKTKMHLPFISLYIGDDEKLEYLADSNRKLTSGKTLSLNSVFHVAKIRTNLVWSK